MEQTYNRAKPWQLLFFVFNNTASNIYLSLMGFVNLYAGNVAGMAVILVSNIMMAARFWDGVTDPIVGFIVDKTNGKLGKFRPFMLVGNLIMLVSVILMFTTTHRMPEGPVRVIYWTAIYMIYIIGYTFQNAATRGGQSVLTNDPKQRPMFARIDSIINALLFTAMTMYITDTLVSKYNGFTAELFREVIFTFGPLSLGLTILAMIGIWEKDQPANYAKLGAQSSYGFKDIFRIIKNNRAIQMLVVAASTDKLAAQVRMNSVVGIMLYGIVIGNYKMLSRMSMITLIPGILMIILGTVFGFFDKVVSSFASTLVGWFCVMIGFAERFPTQEDPLTGGIFWATLFLFIGIPILGWVCSLVAMKFYPLDQDKMIEVQAKIAGMKQSHFSQ